MKKSIGKTFAAGILAAACTLSMAACGNSQSTQTASDSDTAVKAVTDADIKKELGTQLANLSTKSWGAQLSYTNSLIAGTFLQEYVGYDNSLKMYYEDCGSAKAEYGEDVPSEIKTIGDGLLDAYKQVGTVFISSADDTIYLKVDGKLVQVTDQDHLNTLISNALAKAMVSELQKVKIAEAADTDVVVDRNAEIDGQKMIAVGYAAGAATADNTAAALGAIFLMNPETYELKAIICGDGASAQYKVSTTVPGETVKSQDSDTISGGEVYLFTFEWDKNADATADDFKNADVSFDVSDIVKTIKDATEALKSFQ